MSSALAYIFAQICPLPCGEGFQDMELFGKSKQAWLQTFLALPHGIGVCVAMERKPGKCMLRILVIGIPERTQTTLRHRL
jgi:hypothetical protein